MTYGLRIAQTTLKPHYGRRQQSIDRLNISRISLYSVPDLTLLYLILFLYTSIDDLIASPPAYLNSKYFLPLSMLFASGIGNGNEELALESILPLPAQPRHWHLGLVRLSIRHIHIAS